MSAFAPLTTDESKEQLHDSIDTNNESPFSPFECNRGYKNCQQGYWCPLPILHPLGAFKVSWDFFVSICVIISWIEIPFTWAFDIDLEYNTAVGRIVFIVDVIFILDMMLMFRCAYYDKYDKLRLIVTPSLISKHYLKTWFIIDLITAIPLHFFLHFSNYFKFVRLVRIFKVRNIIRCYNIIHKIMRIIPMKIAILIQVAHILALMILCAHWFACLWYAVGKKSYDNSNVTSWLNEYQLTELIPGVTPTFTLYSVSFYWSIVTLFTTGYGDITATNVMEQWIACLVIVSGSIFTAYLIGTMTGVLSEGNSKAVLEKEMINELYEFSQHFRISNNMMRKLEDNIKYNIEHNYDRNKLNKFWDNLPQHLVHQVQEEMAHAANREFNLCDIDLFKQVPPYVAGKLLMKMRHVSCNAHCVLYEKGNIANHIYIQKIGESKLMYSDGEHTNKKRKTKRFKRGDIFGERCLISKYRNGTLMCNTFCEFFVLDKEDIKQTIFDERLMHKSEAEKAWNEMQRMLAQKYEKYGRKHTIQRRIELNNRYNDDNKCMCCTSKCRTTKKQKKEKKRKRMKDDDGTIIRKERQKDEYKAIENMDDALQECEDEIENYLSSSDDAMDLFQKRVEENAQFTMTLIAGLRNANRENSRKKNNEMMKHYRNIRSVHKRCGYYRGKQKEFELDHDDDVQDEVQLSTI